MATKKSTSSSNSVASATTVLRKMDATKVEMLESLKVRFITGSKNGVKLIVQKAGDVFAVYMFSEALQYAGIQPGDVVTILAEYRQSKANGEWYWNATAVSKQE